MIGESFSSKEDLIKAFDEYNEKLYNYAFFRTRLNREISEDLVQDAFLKAWEYRTYFDNKKGSLKTWLFTILNNLIIDFFRKKGNQQLSGIDMEIFEKSVDSTEAKEISKVILEIMLKELDEDESELIILRYFNDLEIAEVAEIVGKTEGATKVALHRVIGKLKEKAQSNFNF